MSRWSLFLVCTTLGALVGSPGRAEHLRVVGWNLESGGAKPAYLSNLIAGMKGVDLWGFSEVEVGDAAKYAKACGSGENGQQFKHVTGTTGGSDRLVIVYNSTKLDLVRHDQMMDLRVQTGRAPLYGVFKLKSTNEQFIFMVNHLHRTNDAKRMEQAVGLKEWATNLTEPAILVGDYNFDVNVNTRRGNAQFVAMTQGNKFHWVMPNPFRATHKGGSVLDFIFLAGSAKTWKGEAQVIALIDDTVNNSSSSDHRPVQADVQTPGTPAPTVAGAPVTTPQPEALSEVERRQQKRNEILKKIGELQDELTALRRLVKELADE